METMNRVCLSPPARKLECLELDTEMKEDPDVWQAELCTPPLSSQPLSLGLSRAPDIVYIPSHNTKIINHHDPLCWALQFIQ